MLFGKKDKVNSVTVSPNEDYVIWNVDVSNVARDTVLNVSQGCVAIYIVNGGLKSTNPAGRWVINSKEEEKSKCKIQLLGVNADKTYDILCGVGGVPYKDDEINAETTVGAHGECKIRVLMPWTLCSVLGKNDVKTEDIDEYIRTKTAELMTTSLAEVLQKYDYTSINTKLTAISDEMKKKISKEFGDFGLSVESFSVKGIHFPDEFKQKREDFFDKANKRKDEKEARREKERAQRAEADVISTIISSSRAGKDSVAPASDVNVPVQYCPKCGMKISKGAVFCPGCGKKL